MPCSAAWAQILEIGKQQIALIEKEGWAVTNTDLSALLGRAATHIRILLLASQGKLEGRANDVAYLVFPLEIDGAIATETQKLQDKYQRLLKAGAKESTIDQPKRIAPWRSPSFWPRRSPHSLSKAQHITIDAYNKNYLKYFRDTAHIDMTDIYGRVRQVIPRGCDVLDAGCGVGRDTRYFIQHGYTVISFDAAREMVNLCRRYPFAYCVHQTFADIVYVEQFDLVWACASLIHLNEPQLRDALERLCTALKPGGHLYLSLIEGEGIEKRDNKIFYKYRETTIRDLASEELCLVETPANPWRNAAKRPGTTYTWPNFIFERREITAPGRKSTPLITVSGPDEMPRTPS